MAFEPSAKHTVASLRANRGKHKYAMLRVETLEEAAAAEAAGVEMFSVPPAMIMDRRFREVAPNAFAFPGDNFYESGVDSISDDKWQTTFEAIYDAPALQVPWYAVLGNHD